MSASVPRAFDVTPGPNVVAVTFMGRFGVHGFALTPAAAFAMASELIDAAVAAREEVFTLDRLSRSKPEQRVPEAAASGGQRVHEDTLPGSSGLITESISP